MKHTTAACALLALAFPAAAQCEVQTFTLDDVSDGIGVGPELDRNGDTLLAGVPTKSPLGTSSGAAYVFARTPSGWVQEAELVPSDGAAFDGFGGSVAVAGTTAAVASPADDDLGPTSGAVYVFERTGTAWRETHKLLASDGQANDVFGSDLALSGDTLFVAAGGKDEVYVLERGASGWSETQRLTASSVQPQSFGSALAVDGDRAIVGDWEDGSLFAGRVYLYDRTPTGWQNVKQFEPTGAEGNIAGLGRSVALSGDTAVAGAFWADGPLTGDIQVGVVHVYRRQLGLWTKIATLFDPDGAQGDAFGRTVDLAGDTLAVFSWRDFGLGGVQGSVFVFAREGPSWVQAGKLLGAPGQTFGLGVTAGPDDVVVNVSTGAPTGLREYSLVDTSCLALSASPHSVSLSAGGSQDLALAAGAAHALELYLLLGSATGQEPGQLVDGLTLPLDLDGYYLFTLSNPNLLIPTSLGFLDAGGAASATLALPAGLSPGLAGLVLHHAFATIDLFGTAAVTSTSNAATLTLVP